jgi:hypothetical protein
MRNPSRYLLLVLIALSVTSAQSQNVKKKTPAAKPAALRVLKVQKPATQSRPATPLLQAIQRTQKTQSPTSYLQQQLNAALAQVRAGQYQQAAPTLYTLSRRNELQNERMQIKYILGVALSEMKLYQTAAFQFVDVIRNGGSKYVRQSIDRLSIAADALGDDTLLNYAISKVRIDEFPQNQKDVVYYRLGEIKLRNGQYAEAGDLFSRVSSNSRYAANARFNRGLAKLESNQPQEALQLFQSLQNSRAKASVTDTNRVASQMAIARTYYQMQDWDKAMEAYREIPRDSEYWHDALFESSWAQLRSAKFRSTLSNLQSLHSAFYEDSFIPESLLVRSIVYLYICKFDETEKTLNLFEAQYSPVRSQLGRFLDTTREPLAYFQEIEKAYYIRKDKKPNQGMRLPYMVARAVLDEGNVKRSFGYLKALNDEKSRIEAIPNIARSPLGIYAMKVLASRFKNSKVSTGEQVRSHLLTMRKNLNDFFEQASFVRYEMINGKKELLKKKIAGKQAPSAQIDENMDRKFYTQNGYEYWPFDGEYWLDEIGNYHYLGQQSCE